MNASYLFTTGAQTTSRTLTVALFWRGDHFEPLLDPRGKRLTVAQVQQHWDPPLVEITVKRPFSVALTGDIEDTHQQDALAGQSCAPSKDVAICDDATPRSQVVNK
eukprot:1972301-Amphidinium_carterae.2